MKNFKKILLICAAVIMTAGIVFAGGVKDTDMQNSFAADLSEDRAGNPIVIPSKIEKIISMAPSVTEILIDLNVADKIIAADTNTQKDGLLKQNIPYFDMMNPDAEQLIALRPDIVFTSGMSRAKGNDPFAPLRAAGICVADIPSSSSTAAIYDDITFISQAVNEKNKGNKLIANMKKEINAIQKKYSAITETEKKTVYFEIGAAPHMYSLGSNTFIHEMLELIGAKNILAKQKNWVAVSDETVISANPDVILTSVNYIPDPVAEIMQRPGWHVISAVKNKRVFRIDNNSSSRPNHNIVKALKQIAAAVYPEY